MNQDQTSKPCETIWLAIFKKQSGTFQTNKNIKQNMPA